MSSFIADVILQYNYPTWLAAINDGDDVEKEAWDDFKEHMVESGMESHEWCEQNGLSYPPAAFWNVDH